MLRLHCINFVTQDYFEKRGPQIVRVSRHTVEDDRNMRLYEYHAIMTDQWGISPKRNFASVPSEPAFTNY